MAGKRDLSIYDQSQQFFAIYSLMVLIARFKPSILGLWIEYSTTVAQVHNLYKKRDLYIYDQSQHFFPFISLPIIVAGFQPLILGYTWIFNHCAAEPQPYDQDYKFSNCRCLRHLHDFPMQM